MFTHGMMAFTIQKSHLKMVDFVGLNSRPTDAEIEEYQSRCERKFSNRKNEFTVAVAPDELVMFMNSAALPDHMKLALGRMEIALDNENWDQCWRVLAQCEYDSSQQRNVDLEFACVAELQISPRDVSSLESAGIIYLKELVQKTPDELCDIYGMNEKSVQDVFNKLREYLNAARNRASVEQQH